MYIKRIILSDIKGFRDLEFSFVRDDGGFAGWNVITGDNGSGKSVLLKCMAMATLGPNTVRALQPQLDGWIRYGAGSGYIGLELVSHEEDGVTTGRKYKRPFWSELALTQTRQESTVTLKPDDTRRKSKKGPLNGPWAETTPGWFAVGYGPFRRLYGASTEAQRLMSGPGPVPRFATMFKEDATLGESEIWLTELNYKKLEGREEEADVLACVIDLLNDEFLRNEVSVERVDSDGLWLKHKDGAVLRLSDMSEGYRAALAMMVDIARHVANTHGALELTRGEDGQLQLPHRGVVLIDEVDAHLHPEWQRQIGFWLKRHFPNMQFIVTTHSALVCQAADPYGIYHLPEPGSEVRPFQLDAVDYKKIIRSKADDILLSPAFGLTHTRSPVAVEARRRFAQLQAKRRATPLTPEEEAKRHQLLLFVDDDHDL